MTQIRMSHPRMATLPIRHSYFTADLSLVQFGGCVCSSLRPQYLVGIFLVGAHDRELRAQFMAVALEIDIYKG